MTGLCLIHRQFHDTQDKDIEYYKQYLIDHNKGE